MFSSSQDLVNEKPALQTELHPNNHSHLKTSMKETAPGSDLPESSWAAFADPDFTRVCSATCDHLRQFTNEFAEVTSSILSAVETEDAQ
jgi:hypothetical protein